MAKVIQALTHATLSTAYALESFHVNHEKVAVLLAAAYFVIAVKHLRDAINAAKWK